jgi:signal transduction histidine kinase
MSWDELYEMYNSGFQVPGVIDLHTSDSTHTEVLYISMIPIQRIGEPGLSGYVFLRFKPRSAPEELGFPELLLAGEDPIDIRVRRYAFSEYRKGHQVRQFGDKAYPINWVRHTKNGPNWFEDDGYKDLAYRNGEVLVVMGTPLPTLLDKATTFSYLFMFYTIIGVALLVLWWWAVEQGGIEWTLRSKVRSTLVLFVLIGSILFGFGARKLLVTSFAERVDSNLRGKTHSVLVELQHKVGTRDRFTDDIKPELDFLLRKFSKVFFSDITLYDLNGELLATSRPQVFDAGLIGRRMAPDAYRSLALEGTSEFIHNEHIGELTYRSAYVPFLSDRGVVLAYLDLPYFARQSELDSGLSALLVAIVNLFVLLFALSMLAALFISNWTTRPLAILERSLAKVDLASNNSPLRYGGRDEIGRLVAVYNEKVNELQESAERLARSERESAWREMARQVAHEIKNPLTPMKLSIQHFERTWSPDQPDARHKLNRFSEGMVDQIDTLSRIAEEFAHFAKMPPSKDEEMDLVEVVKSAVELFKNWSGVELAVDVPRGIDALVVADKDHLVRVFNNLIKNAVQAIPENEEGRVELKIRDEGSKIVVLVTDNGNGIPDDIRERIFMPNFTTRSTGMGLGLAMVKRMVENTGGEVWFDSTIGVGTTFYVSLPKAKK